MFDDGDYALCFGFVASALGAVAFLGYRRAMKTLNVIKGAEEFTGKGDQVKALETNGVISYAYVNGFCLAKDERLTCSALENRGVLCLRTVINEVCRKWDLRSMAWSNKTKTVSDKTESVPFFLRAYSTLILVKEAFTADVLDLGTKHVTFEETKRPALTFVSDLLGKEYTFGIEVVQEALLEGTKLTAIGEIRLNGPTIELCKPGNGLLYILRKTSYEGIVGESESYMLIWKLFSVVTCSLAVGLISYGCARKAYMWYKRQHPTPPAVLESILRCVICKERNANAVFLPCQHITCCQHCAASVYLCPSCFRPVERSLAFHGP